MGGRSYQLKRRAESQDKTRRRIVGATIELHQTLGPRRTTVTDIACRAGVSRLTVYRHFPDEPALLSACSRAYFERHPFPDTDAWRAVRDPNQRFRFGVSEAYAYHRETERMIARALADVGDTPIMAPYHRYWEQAADVIAAAWRSGGKAHRLRRAAILHALQFDTWRSLIRRCKLTDDEALDIVSRLVD